MNREDIIREFDLEAQRSDNYFSLMYKIIQFTFVAVAATLGFAISLIGDANKTKGLCFIGTYAIPLIIYVFGTMYAYNAYAIAISGKRAQKLHDLIYKNGSADIIVKEYILSNKGLVIISYGVTLAFYIFIPLFSISIINYLYKNEVNSNSFLFTIIPVCFLICYYVIMAIEISAIIKNTRHFNNHKIKPKRKKKKR